MKKTNVNGLKEVLDRIIQSKLMRSVMIWGPPGAGKSSAVIDIARKYKLQFIDVRISQMAPTDLRGLPRPGELMFGIYQGDEQDDQIRQALTHQNPEQVQEMMQKGRIIKDISTTFAAPDFLPRETEKSAPRAILFLDELNQAPPTSMAIAQQLLLDRKIGQYTLPDSVFIFAAGNRRADLAAVNQMPTPVSNRLLHIEVQPEVEEWISYARTQPWNAEVVNEYLIYGGKEKLLKVPNRIEESPSFPSPRSWHMACELLQSGFPLEDLTMAVGDEATRELLQYSKAGVPRDAAKILKGEKPEFPQDHNAAIGLVIQLAQTVSTPGELANAIDYVPEGEMSQLLIHHASKRLRQEKKLETWWKDPALTKHPVAAQRITNYVNAQNNPG